ncbi:E3 ubiquitin-protein ligase TRIM38-like [Scleropages formosus]|uniref:E3 ubiquitin-protein ligase TRIM38-like n=1 Tax=Scleropages formosus TaxID=113540 RepID=A0A8C9R5J2_SCLFO|nr:E3 ubiquitin-protein ligase TRIM38-like [Scleropages formosus]
MASAVSDHGNEGDCLSCLSLGSLNTKDRPSHQCKSNPFFRPRMSFHQKVAIKFKQLVDGALKKGLKLDAETSISKSGNEASTLDECKLLIRDLAEQLDRVLQHKSPLVLRGVKEDKYGEENFRQLVLEWATELSNLPDKHLRQAAAVKSSCTKSPVERSSEEQRKDTDPRIQVQEKRLKEAENILHGWAWKLRSMPKDSVCLGEDVCSVLHDLERQWKRGKLSNTLPVMDFIMWAVIQEQPEEGSAPQCWIKSKQRFSTAVSLKYIPDSVWNWILKAHAEVTLDPKTANPYLIMRDDRKSVKMDTIIESREKHRDGFHRAHHQYNGWCCILGTEGFTTGRHYWEVDVKGKRDWRIGVVKESAPRNGYVSLNTQSGYWTLRLQLGILTALTVPVTKFPKVVIPSKVGVYLDVEEGQLSFYDAERRSHIYTFNDTFTEKVYPVFGTIETDIALVIL